MRSLLLPTAEVDEENEASTVKRELEKCYKRIADLETRIHDLTLQINVVSSYILLFISDQSAQWYK